MDIARFNSYLAAIIRSARIRAALTQTELATRAGVSRRYIQSIENGKQEAALSTLFAIANAMEVSPSSLISELENAIKSGHLSQSMRVALPPQRLGRPKKNYK